MEQIARGSTADVYAWGEGRVLKLFHASRSRASVDAEAQIGRAVAQAGIAAPQVYEVLKQDGRWGIVYERVSGSILFEQLRPWNARRLGQKMAHLHTTLFTQHVPDLPRQRERLTRRIATAPLLSDAERQHMIAILETLPDGDVLCHGDFHPENLIQTAHGLTIIDWNDATQGHPTADIARTILILDEACAMIDVLTPQMIGDAAVPHWVHGAIRRLFGWMAHTFLHGYRQTIEQLVPESTLLIPRWLPVLAAARLHEGQYSEAPKDPDDVDLQQRMIEYMLKKVRHAASFP